MIDHTTPLEFVLDRLWFSHQGQLFTGRGFMEWNPEHGFRINAFLDKAPAPTNPFATLGKVIIETKEDTYAVWLRIRGFGSAIVPGVFPAREKLFVSEGRYSIEAEHVIFFLRFPWKEERESWTGSTVFLTKEKLRFPDSLERKTSLNGELIELQKQGGLRYEDSKDCSIFGRHLTDDSFELSWSLSKDRWTKTDAWKFGEAARRALSIVFAQTISIVKANVRRGNTEIIHLRERRAIFKLGHYHRPLVESGPPDEAKFNKSTFVHLTKFFLSNDPNTEICWLIFRRMAESSRQETWESRELLMAMALEAVLRTVDNHPFRDGDYSWKIQQSLSSFKDKYLNEKWTAACEKALNVRDRLRHRNAHPDWLTKPGGVMSKEEQTKSIEDLIFLSRFYGYMILALAGLKDLDPKFPKVQFYH